MKTLLIMRHGQAQAHAASDSLRELTERGRQDVSSVCRALSSELAQSTQLWMSPYRRARQTMDILVGTLGVNIEPQEVNSLTPESSPKSLCEALEQHDANRFLIVSHMPLVADLVQYLTGAEPGRYVFGTASVARIDAEVFAGGLGQLCWLRHREDF
ncbi:phosphohistidine phosphatase SixA [Marinimicrobium sp. ARAG 43.8]|uniref:phosphohistidine phosphatase SixA n=1 Tax=Marinimicrobium sp. ARAG 43.8 TaxID=3418719 RepID=UPI003CE6CCD5